MDLVVIGCGNLLRGDDAVGPELVRRLAARGLPSGMRCVDAGTGGMDAVLGMRGAGEAIVVDACRSGRPPGAVVEVTGAELDRLPSHAGIDIHSFRWHHAVRLGRLLLGDGFPAQVTAWLVEGESFEPGAGLAPAVDRTVDTLANRLLGSFRGLPDVAGGAGVAGVADPVAGKD